MLSNKKQGNLLMSMGIMVLLLGICGCAKTENSSTIAMETTKLPLFSEETLISDTKIPSISTDLTKESTEPVLSMIVADSIDMWVTSETVSETTFTKSLIRDFLIWNVAYGQVTSEGVPIWGATLSQNTPYLEQRVVISAAEEVNQLLEEPIDGFVITSLAYGDEKWVAVLSTSKDFNKQEIEINDELSSEYINQQAERGYYISAIGYGDGKWVIVTALNQEKHDQLIYRSDTVLWDQIEDAQKDHLFLAHLVFGQGEWVMVLSSSSLESFEYHTFSFFSKDIIQDCWDHAYHNIQVYYGDGDWVHVCEK